jgi:hypothetical protein
LGSTPGIVAKWYDDDADMQMNEETGRQGGR